MSSTMRSTAGIAVTAVAGHAAAMHTVRAYPALRRWAQHPGRLSLPCSLLRPSGRISSGSCTGNRWSACGPGCGGCWAARTAGVGAAVARHGSPVNLDGLPADHVRVLHPPAISCALTCHKPSAMSCCWTRHAASPRAETSSVSAISVSRLTRSPARRKARIPLQAELAARRSARRAVR
jgi:hypothetical protein